MNDITPKEAIANLNHIYGMVSPDIQRSLDVAIKALERPTGDLISREALKDAIENQDKFACLPDTTLVPFRMLNEPEKNYEPYVHLRDIRNAIDNAQAVPQVTVFTETADEKAVADLKAELQSVIEPRPTGDCLSRELLKKDIEAQISDFNELNKKGEPYKEFKDIRAILFGLFISKNLINNASTVVIDCKNCDGYEAGYSAGVRDTERPQCNQIAWEQGYECVIPKDRQDRPQGEWRDNLIEVFRQSAEVGGDTFHLFEIERIINGEPI